MRWIYYSSGFLRQCWFISISSLRSYQHPEKQKDSTLHSRYLGLSVGVLGTELYALHVSFLKYPQSSIIRPNAIPILRCGSRRGEKKYMSDVIWKLMHTPKFTLKLSSPCNSIVVVGCWQVSQIFTVFLSAELCWAGAMLPALAGWSHKHGRRHCKSRKMKSHIASKFPDSFYSQALAAHIQTSV